MVGWCPIAHYYNLYFKKASILSAKQHFGGNDITEKFI